VEPVVVVVVRVTDAVADVVTLAEVRVGVRELVTDCDSFLPVSGGEESDKPTITPPTMAIIRATAVATPFVLIAILRKLFSISARFSTHISLISARLHYYSS